ncbi:DUF6299 family protein [Kitasatospora viridis]|uniref:DUF6299 domain-containing protein n=1 Tax=Kitasatospora viridis TaxID=281105 RepID=A0A561SF47_9ACTN|nr:DUF6299 family protein [Kitasatospora viridis]TWF73504.1 hypothetical protein FHX73_15116 [Kitasatospora viridis]
MAVRPSARAAVVGALFCIGLTPVVPAVAAPAYPSSDQVTVSPDAVLGSDGSVTLSGTYRCTDPGAVFVSAGLRSGDTQQSIGSSRAVCDGAEHTWSSKDTPRYLALNSGGPAEAEVSLLRLDTSGGLPMPQPLVVQHQAVTLNPAG